MKNVNVMHFVFCLNVNQLTPIIYFNWSTLQSLPVNFCVSPINSEVVSVSTKI